METINWFVNAIDRNREEDDDMQSYFIYCTPMDRACSSHSTSEEELIFHVRAQHEEQALAFLENSDFGHHKYDEVIKIECLETLEVFKNMGEQ